MDDILDGLPGVVSIADDIVVNGSTPQEQSQRLTSLLLRAREKGLVFNPAKCAIAESKIQFFGNTYSKGGVRPDPAKVEAIAQLKAPTSTKDLQSFLGMVTHIAPFTAAPARLQRMLLRLQQYDYNIIYRQART